MIAIKVNDENQLNDDEHEATNHSKIHSSWTKVVMRDEESTNTFSNDKNALRIS